MFQIFISYPNQDEEIVGNLRERLDSYGIKAWMYSYDKTISKSIWEEINEKIDSCKIVLFIISKHSSNAQGQQKELDLAIERFQSTPSSFSILPIIVGDIAFSNIPESINHINGTYLDIYNIKTVTLEITKLVKPDILKEKWEWRCPLPCQWLEVSNLDKWTEEYFELGDLVYFRRLSPMGLFECYAPKLKSLFWFSSRNLRPASFIDEDRSYERENVPDEYRVGTMLMRELNAIK